MMKKREERKIGSAAASVRRLFFVLLTVLLVSAGAFPAAASSSSDETRGMLDEFLEGFSSVLGENRSLRNAEIEKIPDQKYTGRAITPTVKVYYLGIRLKRGTDYTVTYTYNRNVGTAKCKITGKGKYTGTRTVSFKIVRKNASAGSSSSSSSSSSKTSGKTFRVKLSKDTYIYNGEYRKPTVKVTAGNKSVTARNYTVKYSDNRSVGTSTVTVTGKGDYSGYKGTAKFTITLKKPSLSSVKSTTEGQLYAKWQKDTQADGYQIQYSTRKNFSGSDRTKLIKSGRITDCTIEKLTSGKKYYVRMRSFKKVGSKNSYSEWSAVKERTIK